MNLNAITLAITRPGGVRSWDPLSLFTTGVNGTWYDPSDFTRYMSSLGPELVTNGDFSNGTTGWTLGAGWSVSAGKAQFAPGAIGSIYQAGMTIGKWYKVTYTVDSISGSWVRFNYGVAGTNRTTPGTYSQVLLAAGSFIEIQADSTTTATIDNISVRELTALDTATLFQDAAGTLPVTAVEQPVGLMLDKSKGLVLGPELVTNGDFTANVNGWAVTTGDGTLTWVSGKARLTGGTTNSFATQTETSGANKWYKVQYTATAVSATKYAIRFGGTFLEAGTTNFGSRTKYVFSSGANPLMELIAYAGETVDFDNISVRELPGNHAFNSSGNSANFPVLSARYNLLTKSEDFSNAVWTKNGTSTAPSPNTLNFPALNEAIFQDVSTTATVGTAATFSVELSGSGTIYIGCYRSAGAAYEEDSLKITLTATPTRYSVSHTIINAGQNGFGGYISRAADGTATTVTANKAQLTYTNDALNQPDYQRVNTATDYDTAGFKPYLKFNGTNQWLQTNSIDFSYGDKMFVCAGVRKLSDASVGVVTELSVSAGGGTSGTFVLHGQTSPVGYRYAAGSGASGAAFATDDASVFTAPITNVVSGISDFAGATIADEISVRVNGATPTQSRTGTVSTGNFGNYPLYIGARGGSSLWFNGRLYQLVIADGGYQAYLLENDDFLLLEDGTSMLTEYGSNLALPTIQLVEAFVNNKTGAY